jgi:2-polyprenyl-3-methyl-5-hydroxy-6-metoxy-1,4-benzoquinol methylase
VTERYDFAYGEDTVYSHVVELVRHNRLADGDVVIDVGCGFGAVAEPLSSLGLSYIGFDSDPVAVGNLQARSFEAEAVDFSDAEHAVRMVAKRLGDRKLSAVVMIDSLEHLPNGSDVLRALQHFAVSQGCAPIVIAVPNVTHIDLAGKLLLGRWDVTEVGLLDDTHVAFFSEDRLRTVMAESGWLQIAADDFELSTSDQHFPADAAVLQYGAPLHELLFRLRDNASNAAIVNEFVRAYCPVATPVTRVEDEASAAPFLSVLMRTQNSRQATLQESLLSLAAQSCTDFEILLLPHDVPKDDLHDLRYIVDSFPPTFADRVRIVPVDGGGRSRPLNVGITQARGAYIAILDDDDVVFAHWVSQFAGAAAKCPGRVLRAVAAEQDVEPTAWDGIRPGYEIVSRPYQRFPTTFDVVDHLINNYSPPCSLALPRSIFRDLGLRFDETLPVLEDWDVLVQAVLVSGVSSIEEVTSLWRRWRVGDSSTSVHSAHEWARARMAVLAKLDERPVLLPPRTITKLLEKDEALTAALSACDRIDSERDEIVLERNEVMVERDRFAHELHRTEIDRVAIHDNLLEAHRQLEEIRASTSWRLGKPVRVAGGMLRRIVGRTD